MNLTNQTLRDMCSRLTERQQWGPGQTMTLLQARVAGTWHSIYLVEDDLLIRLRASGHQEAAPVVGWLTSEGWQLCQVADQDMDTWRQANAAVLRILETYIPLNNLGMKQQERQLKENGAIPLPF